MKEHPILFSGPMVRAILAGRKTQTRRVIQLRNPNQPFADIVVTFGYSASGESTYAGFGNLADPVYVRCPYGQPGDLLWVREKFLVWEGGAGGLDPDSLTYQDDPQWEHQLFDNGELDDALPPEDDGVVGRWKVHPSIHMPRWASRITLRVTDVRVQRVQEISEEDAIAEGITRWEGDRLQRGDKGARNDFSRLWDSINAKRGYSWESNPFCWAITFERVTP